MESFEIMTSEGPRKFKGACEFPIYEEDLLRVLNGEQLAINVFDDYILVIRKIAGAKPEGEGSEG